MGGGEYRTMDENEGSLARNWWNRASSKPAEEQSHFAQQSRERSSQGTPEAGKATIATEQSAQETEDLAFLTAVVPRPQPPPSRPAKSKPIDIPKKRTTPPPVFAEVAQDKRYWYQ